jgi:hypothetical protein
MKRASIKGQGADIFFSDGDEQRQTLSPLVQSTPPETADVATSVRPGVLAPERQDIKTSIGVSGRASGIPEAQERRFLARLVLPATLKRRLRAVLRDERRIHTTVRFSPEEMAALRDLLYELEAKKGIKVTRNEVMRLALHFFLEDYGIRKEESLLLQILKEDEE